MAGRNDWTRLIRALAPKYHLDPRALLAVASQEGLSGGVGDGGHAFGPFQLNDSGGVITGRPGNHRAFAESPQGIEWALQQIGQVAGGLQGGSAVRNIVSRFERPRDAQGEIARALAAYGQFGGAASAGPPVPANAAPPIQQNQGLRQSIAGSLASGKQIDFLALARTAAQQQQQQAPTRSLASAAAGGPPPSAGGSPPRGALAEAFYDPIGQWDNGRFSTKGIGGHSDHVHLSITNPQAMLEAIRYAQTHGLAARENPYIDHVDPVHVKGSYHYRDFPGKYNGRQLGEAVDVSGDPAKMAAYFKWALTHLR